MKIKFLCTYGNHKREAEIEVEEGKEYTISDFIDEVAKAHKCLSYPFDITVSLPCLGEGKIRVEEGQIIITKESNKDNWLLRGRPIQ